MGDMRKPDLHPGRKKRHAAHQHSIYAPNHAAIKPGAGFEARNRFVLRPSRCPDYGQLLDAERSSRRLSDARYKLTRPCGPGCER